MRGVGGKGDHSRYRVMLEYFPWRRESRGPKTRFQKDHIRMRWMYLFQDFMNKETYFLPNLWYALFSYQLWSWLWFYIKFQYYCLFMSLICNIWKCFEKGSFPFASIGAVRWRIALKEVKTRIELRNKVCIFYPLKFVPLFDNIQVWFVSKYTLL